MSAGKRPSRAQRSLRFGDPEPGQSGQDERPISNFSGNGAGLDLMDVTPGNRNVMDDDYSDLDLYSAPSAEPNCAQGRQASSLSRSTGPKQFYSTGLPTPPRSNYEQQQDARNETFQAHTEKPSMLVQGDYVEKQEIYNYFYTGPNNMGAEGTNTSSLPPTPPLTPQRDIGRVRESIPQPNGCKCMVCSHQYAAVLFLPCQHLVCCANCARRFSTCPKCSLFIREKRGPISF